MVKASVLQTSSLRIWGRFGFDEGEKPWLQAAGSGHRVNKAGGIQVPMMMLNSRSLPKK
jgi:hypothetical protein